METPLVSIIVRTKDRPELLQDALKSIADQTYKSIETVIVNDGGCDVNSVDLETILGHIPLTYVKNETSLGRGAALNIGLEKSKGIYVAFLDDDDIYDCSGIAALVDTAIENRADAVYGQVVCRSTRSGGEEAETTEKVLGEPFDFGKLLFENFIATNSLLVSRELAQKTGPFDNDFEIFEDWDWIIRMASICEPRFTDTVVGEYRMFSSSTLTGKGGKALHRLHKEKLLEKHLGKAKGGDFLDHVQRAVDKIVLEKDTENHHLMDQIESLTEEVGTKTEWVSDRDLYIVRLQEAINKLEETIAELEEALRQKDEHIEWLTTENQTITAEYEAIKNAFDEILSSRSWKITKPVRAFGAAAKKVFPKKNNV